MGAQRANTGVMKYWFFNGSDVVGPFSLKELTEQKGFNADSLICPEACSDQDDHWQPARSFKEVEHCLLPDEPEEDTPSFEQEMDTLLRQTSPLAFEKTNTDGPNLQLPNKPAKPGPIEDYFNHIQKEDLGEILGIPAPAENSDMDLAHALEKQLAQTSSARQKEKPADIDEQTAAHLEQELSSAQETHHVATVTEVFATRAPLSGNVSQAVTVDTPAHLATQTAQETAHSLPSVPAQDGAILPSAGEPPVAQTRSQQPVLPISHENALQHPPVVQTTPQRTDPAVTNSSAPTHLPGNFQADHSTPQPTQVPYHGSVSRSPVLFHTHAKRTWVFMLALGTIVGSVLVLQGLRAHPVDLSPQAPPAAPAALAVTTPKPAVPAPAVTPQDRQDRALEIVQNYALSGSRGTISHYLTKLYQPQLAQGYVARWEAEPLHKNAYLVKYQLTKTRKEPIIYIFQADVSTGKLTGALNNISLDLVGKIL